MIVKEMYSPGPRRDGRARRWHPRSWTVMIKDAKGSQDGWFWGGLWTATRRCRNRATASKPPFNCAQRRLRPVVSALPRVGGKRDDVRLAQQHQGLSRQPAQLLRRQHVANTAAARSPALVTSVAPGHKRSCRRPIAAGHPAIRRRPRSRSSSSARHAEDHWPNRRPIPGRDLRSRRAAAERRQPRSSPRTSA